MARKKAGSDEAKLRKELARVKAELKATVAKRRRTTVEQAKPTAAPKRKSTKPAKRRSAYPSQSAPTLPNVRCVPPFEWLPEGLARWGAANRRKSSDGMRFALQAEVVDGELAAVEFGARSDVLDSEFLFSRRLPAEWQHLPAAIDKTRKRLSDKHDRSVSVSDVIRTAVARFLRREGFGPQK